MGKIVETNRLIVRTWERSDAQALFELCSDADVMEHIGDGKPLQKVEEAEKMLEIVSKNYAEKGFSRYAVVEKSSGKLIGSCGFVLLNNGEVELGYLFAKDSWGKGFATEAAKACAKFGFEKFGFENLVALTDIDHTATHRVLEKVGFKKRGIETIHIDEDLVFELKNQDITDS